MAVVSSNPLEYAEQLEAAGMPREQAQVVAKGLTTMFIHNFDELVTKDYLDTRFSEFESRIDLRFVELESKMDVRFARMNVIQGVILLALVIPVLQAVLTWIR